MAARSPTGIDNCLINMFLRRKQLNISLIILALILGGLAARLYRLPPLVIAPDGSEQASIPSSADTVAVENVPAPADTAVAETPVISEQEKPVKKVETTGFRDADPSAMLADHPFRIEAVKILSGRLEETDSISRRRILSYCEHLRAAYTTRDIDFIRQVFSDNALIIVGHVVKSARSDMAYSDKVQYSIRTKKEYVERLERIFKSKKELDVQFSDFRVMRHPTVPGIYGVTLRQKYACDDYSDEGFLFLLWDFRNPSLPLIHVRTWQPTQMLADADDIIDISDFNLE